MSTLLLILCILWAATVALLLTRAVLQYGKYEVLRPLPHDSPGSDWPAVAVIIPARNEQDTIGRALAGLCAQNYPPDRWRAYVVNDQSTDGTAAVVQSVAQTDPRIRLITGQPLPSGWTGKPHACFEGVSAALQASPPVDWLCFLDADTVADPPLLRTAVEAARQRQLDLLSLEPTQELLTFGERMILPTGFLLLAFIHDLGAVNDPRRPEATANGQFLLARTSVYQQLHGHAAVSVRNAICEDAALARMFKSTGHAIALLGTDRLLRARMYRSFAGLWEGLGKNLTEMIGSAGATLFTAVAALGLAAAAVGLPIWAAVLASEPHRGSSVWIALALGCLGSAAMLGTHIGTAKYLKIPWAYGLLFPVGYVMGAALAVSAVLRRARRQVAWKGRVYQPGALATETSAAGQVPLSEARA